MAHTVARVFTKRETEKSAWSGRVGHAELFVSDDGAWTLDGKVLPRVSIEYLMNFSLQSLQDAYAGADSMDEAQANWTKKYNALVEGTIGQRSSDGVDEETRVARKVVLAALIAKYGKDSEQAKSDEAALDALFEKNKKAFAPIVADEMARLAEQRAAKKAIASAIGSIDI